MVNETVAVLVRWVCSVVPLMAIIARTMMIELDVHRRRNGTYAIIMAISMTVKAFFIVRTTMMIPRGYCLPPPLILSPGCNATTEA